MLYVPAGSDMANVPVDPVENVFTMVPIELLTSNFPANGLSAHFPVGSDNGCTGQVGPISAIPRMPELVTGGTIFFTGGGVVGGVVCGVVVGSAMPTELVGAADGDPPEAGCAPRRACR